MRMLAGCGKSNTQIFASLVVIYVILTCLYFGSKSSYIVGNTAVVHSTATCDSTEYESRNASDYTYDTANNETYVDLTTTTTTSSSNVTNSNDSSNSKEANFNDTTGYEGTNEYWVKRVKGFCADNNTKVDLYGGYVFNFGLPTYVWMASEKHHLFYCAIPKASSTTWKNYLMEDNKYKWKGDLHTAATRLGVQWIAARMNKTKEFRKFLKEYRPSNRLMIVRNPWARLVSAYKDKLVRSKWNLGHLCVAAGKYPQKKNVTFERFVDCLTKSNRKVMWNSHVHPYSSLCALCHMDYNIIAKMEELDKADPLILSRLNFTNELKYVPPAKGKYSNTYSAYYSNVTEEQIVALRDIYKNDLELFNYPNTPYQ